MNSAELEAKDNVRVACIAADLTEPETPQKIYDYVRSRYIEVDVLINNAAFGGHGRFHERDWKRDEAMIRLNVMALTEVTHLFVKDIGGPRAWPTLAMTRC